jgi:hypothetical protein
MAYNDRIEVDSGDISHEQLAPSQSGRTKWYPGKATSRPNDMNWEKDKRIPTGTPAFSGEAAGPVNMERVRVTKLGRNIVCDQTVLAPVVTGVRVETRCEEGINGENTTIDTANPPNLADRERQAGHDWIKGA